MLSNLRMMPYKPVTFGTSGIHPDIMKDTGSADIKNVLPNAIEEATKVAPREVGLHLNNGRYIITSGEPLEYQKDKQTPNLLVLRMLHPKH